MLINISQTRKNCFRYLKLMSPLMVMHPHTKYHCPISKDKNVMARTSFAEKKQKKRKWKQKRKKKSD